MQTFVNTCFGNCWNALVKMHYYKLVKYRNVRTCRCFCGCCSCHIENRMRTSAAINKQLKWKYNFQVVCRLAVTHTHTRYALQSAAVCVCVGDPIKKLQSTHSSTEKRTDCRTHGMAHLWHRLLLTYAIKLSRKYCNSPYCNQIPAATLRMCLHLYFCIIKTEYAQWHVVYWHCCQPTRLCPSTSHRVSLRRIPVSDSLSISGFE